MNKEDKEEVKRCISAQFWEMRQRILRDGEEGKFV